MKTKQNLLFGALLVLAVTIINLKGSQVLSPLSNCTLKQVLTISLCQAELDIDNTEYDVILPFTITDDMSEDEIAYLKKRAAYLKQKYD